MPHGIMGFGGMGIMRGLFGGVVILALVLLVAAAFSGRHSRHVEDAMEILKIRYARGEIDKHRFDTIRRELRQEINYEC